MSEVRFYLSLIPQALVASMLSPDDFGLYYATGKQAHTHGEAIFFEVDPDWRSDDFPFDISVEKCVPGPDGQPKESVYMGIYRVLSRVPVSALGSLYLVTPDGVVLELNKMQYTESEEKELHLYQEFCPITPMVASRLNPRQFCDFITDQSQPIHVPRIVFSELRLNGLSSDPKRGDAHDLPYHNLQHLRDCLSQIDSSHKETKLVAKQATEGVLYRMVKGGFYVGDHAEFAYYPYPSIDELETRCRSWWRSAQIASRPWI
ncbi:hypothetical protein [Pseudohalioglobus lutimaris]|uniref:Uncharacterized protein n=1 Tax=Pseudohalioglobus lutimaris TaxID=1737061 RepID=A0A2N5X6K3_9GAMM|nr:hypothetical protein [Pseudohalioglobus lutimaris]PLW70122.1 hypothetical protein C0039_02630 [Pseudohalioglobus lutimaris]